MNKIIRNIIIWGAVLAGGIIAAVFGYNALSSNVSPESASSADVGDETVIVQGAEREKELAGKAASDFTMLDNEGDKISLSEHYGKPLVINFWATWCPPCKQEMPFFDKAYKERGDIVDFMMVNLTDGIMDDVLSVRDYIADSGYKFPVYFDTEGEGVDAYGVIYLPITVFIRADGTVMETHSGALSEDRLNSYIDELLKP